MKKVLYTALVGASALAFSAGAMAQSDAGITSRSATGYNSSDATQGAMSREDANNPSASGGVAANSGTSNAGTSANMSSSAQADSSSGMTGASVDANVSQAHITDTQQALRDEGFAVSVDGVWGPSTARAVAEFQQQNELPVTGQLDNQTLAALNIERDGNR